MKKKNEDAKGGKKTVYIWLRTKESLRNPHRILERDLFEVFVPAVRSLKKKGGESRTAERGK